MPEAETAKPIPPDAVKIVGTWYRPIEYLAPINGCRARRAMPIDSTWLNPPIWIIVEAPNGMGWYLHSRAD